MDQQTIAKGLAIILGAIPKIDLPEKTVEVWALVLADLTQAQFERGVVTFCRENAEVYPTTNIPALIRKYAVPPKQSKASIDGEAKAAFAYHWNQACGRTAVAPDNPPHPVSERGLPVFV